MMRDEQQSICEIDAGHRVLRIVQLTDTHLHHQPGGTLIEMDTDRSLQEVIATVKSERHQIDIILVTGDISDHGGEDAYKRFYSYINALNTPHFWLAGNHDDPEAMSHIVGNGPQLSGSIETPHWQILMLNSQVPGEIGGELGPDQLDWLQQRLDVSAKRSANVLVCLHHHPITIGCNWLDEQVLADAQDFWTVLERHQHVRGVLWGHIHQELCVQRRHIQLMASPSTCVQFAPNSENFKADDKAPGYRWLDLHPNGHIDTAVSRITGVNLAVDLESGGYLT